MQHGRSFVLRSIVLRLVYALLRTQSFHKTMESVAAEEHSDLSC